MPAPRQESRPTYFGLDSMVVICQEFSEWLFLDQSARFNLDSAPTPLIAHTVNMVEIRDTRNESLVVLLEKAPTDTDHEDNHFANEARGGGAATNFITLAPTKFFGGNIFHTVSNNEPIAKGENEGNRQARKGRNADRA